MPRFVLLEIDDREVDVLSHLSESERREALIVHSNPEALVRELAALAEIPVAPVPPPPAPDDVLVVTGRPDAQVRAWADDWRRAGARVVPASSFVTGGVGAAGDREEPQETAREAEVSTEGGAAAEDVAIPPVVKERTRARERPAEPLTMVPKNTPADIWTSPEATFRYLVGDVRRGALWWDGGVGVWVPWIVLGEERPGDTPPRGIDIPVEWGRFRLTGLEGSAEGLPQAALARVAEDLALRDLAAWRKTETALSGLGRPGRGETLPVLRRWGEQVLEALGPEAGFLWRGGEGSDWELVAARGDGVRFAGELRLSELLLGSLFDAEGSSWWTWETEQGIRLDILVAEEDTRWPLRLHRVRRALEERTRTA